MEPGGEVWSRFTVSVSVSPVSKSIGSRVDVSLARRKFGRFLVGGKMDNREA